MAAAAAAATFRVTSTLLLMVVLFACCDVAISTMLESTALINLKKSFTQNNALVSWKPGSDPCSSEPSSWTGITCIKTNVVGIRLESIGLSGLIDVNSLLNIRQLRTISIVNNSFSGPIPDFSRLINIRMVILSGNHFSGSIPPNYFNNMVSLKKLCLSYNNFSGPIPTSFGKLPRMIDLQLKNNSFSGEIPAMDQPSLEILDLSNNKLQGQVPPNLRKFGTTSFVGNPGLCGTYWPLLCSANNNNNDNLDEPSSGVSNVSTDTHTSKRVTLGMMTFVGVIFGVVGVGTILSRYKHQDSDGKSNVLPNTMNDCSVWSQKKVSSGKVKGEGVDDLVFVNHDKGVFGMLDLMRAGAEVMGHGLLGSSYKAKMSNGLKVMVKRVKDMNKVDRAGFDEEMGRIGNLRHQNVLPLLSYQYRAEEKLLVSEFISQGSLACILNGDRDKFDWPARLKVVQGIAQGLSYLQSELQSSSDLPHGHLKSSNVLIGSDFEPLLVDYGFDALMKPEQAAEALTSYTSPEASGSHHKVTSKSDVYCLGIIILEILTGKTLSQCKDNDKIDDIITAITDKKEHDVIDSELVKMKKTSGEITKLMRIGVDCTKSDPNQRLGLDEAIKKITDVQAEGVEIEEDNVQQQAHTETLREEHDQSEQGQFR